MVEYADLRNESVDFSEKGILYVKYGDVNIKKEYELKPAKDGDVGLDLPVVIDKRLKIEPYRDYYINYKEEWFDTTIRSRRDPMRIIDKSTRRLLGEHQTQIIYSLAQASCSKRRRHRLRIRRPNLYSRIQSEFRTNQSESRRQISTDHNHSKIPDGKNNLGQLSSPDRKREDRIRIIRRC